jgi:transmembrane sensor
MNYSSYEPEDFATDAFFCQWVLQPAAQHESFWQHWIKNHPDKSTDIEMARQLVLLASTDDGQSPSESTIERIWEGIEEGRQAHMVSLRSGRIMWMKAAAAVALLILAFGGYFYKKTQNNTYRTAYGESRKLSLPDGSLVTLNANSTLRVSDHWGQPREREVWLEGEAFFTVSKIRRKGVPVKFVVHTHDLKVEVKGTEFNVNTRKNQTLVVLSEGLVHLYLNDHGPHKEIRMKPGDLVNFSSTNQKLSVCHLPDTSPIHSWKNNRWTLNETSLTNIADLIHETYGVTVSISGDSLGKQKVNGIVPTDNMQDLLSALESILPITITRHEDIVTIRERP